MLQQVVSSQSVRAGSCKLLTRTVQVILTSNCPHTICRARREPIAPWEALLLRLLLAKLTGGRARSDNSDETPVSQMMEQATADISA